jgi:thymidylate synthase
MKVYNVRNVNHAYPIAVCDILLQGVKKNSRAGTVLEFPEPVATTYTCPDERVLFNKVRMANPFFHFIEGLWIIHGARDVKFLDYFNSQMKQYSDNGVDFYGAYGYRLRHSSGSDQIKTAIHRLRVNPDDRRVYMSMWDPDLDLGKSMKDHPCNVGIALKIRSGKLDMTVFCRSNDLIYGCYGANVVHMSMLQEYLAGSIGVGLGIYTQVSDSLHVYTDLPLWQEIKSNSAYFVDDAYTSEYPEVLVHPYPMMKIRSSSWDDDLNEFMLDPMYEDKFENKFFSDVAVPIARCWAAHKETRNGLSIVDNIKASDWRAACKQWLEIKEYKV